MTGTRPAPWFVLLTMLFLLAGGARAEVGTAEKFVREAGEHALASLTADISVEQRARRFRRILHDTFDLESIARFTLGRYWRQALPEQRAEFRRLLEEFMVGVYISRFGELDIKSFRVSKARAISARDDLVTSEIVLDRGRPPLRVAWRVRSKDGGARIVDVLVGGISLSVTQRAEFAAVITRGGGKVESLLALLRRRAAAD